MNLFVMAGGVILMLFGALLVTPAFFVIYGTTKHILPDWIYVVGSITVTIGIVLFVFGTGVLG
jgi:protein-S-isoprenylcysteine O-methyltransferase Ste14